MIMKDPAKSSNCEEKCICGRECFGHHYEPLLKEHRCPRHLLTDELDIKYEPTESEYRLPCPQCGDEISDLWDFPLSRNEETTEDECYNCGATLEIELEITHLYKARVLIEGRNSRLRDNLRDLQNI